MKVYSRDYHHACHDEMLIQAVKVLALKSETEGDTDLYKKNYKHTCNVVRQGIGITDVVCLAIHSDEDDTYAMILPFPVKATNDNFYDMEWDAEEQKFYIEVEEGVLLND